MALQYIPSRCGCCHWWKSRTFRLSCPSIINTGTGPPGTLEKTYKLSSVWKIFKRISLEILPPSVM
jgi:hypothetical protein